MKLFFKCAVRQAFGIELCRHHHHQSENIFFLKETCPASLIPSGVPSPPVHPCRPSSLHQLQAEKESGGRKWGGGEGRMNLQHPPTAISFWNIAINHNREKTLYFFISEKNSGRNIKKKKTFLPAGEQVELSF